MGKTFSATLMIGTALLLAGCGEKNEGELEKGQVVATVSGKDITVHELNAELQGAQIPAGITAEQRKQLEQGALQQVVNRRIMSDM